MAEKKKKYCKSLDELNEEEFRRDIRQEVLEQIKYHSCNDEAGRLYLEMASEKALSDPKDTVLSARFHLFHWGDEEDDFWDIIWDHGECREFTAEEDQLVEKMNGDRKQDAVEINQMVLSTILKWCINHGFVRYEMQDYHQYTYLAALDPEYENLTRLYDYIRQNDTNFYVDDYIAEFHYETFEPERVNEQLKTFMESILSPFHMEVIREEVEREEHRLSKYLANLLLDDAYEILNDHIEEVIKICFE